MKTEFRRAIVPAEIRSLVIFDHKAVRDYPADWFSRDDWKTCESWWMIIDGRKIGCCAFENRGGSLYVVTTGILPGFQRLGFGTLLKQWQVAYARRHGFTRILTNTRKRNRAMIALNEKVGFKVIRITPNYYQSPREPTVVMELLL
jgi:ribosomal protein S18 acetylase RimI-like enzyme